MIAAKIECYNTKTGKWYYSFITPEAYKHLKNYMDLRKSNGETITGESWLLRNTWKTKSQRFGNYLRLDSEPIQLKSSGIRIPLNKVSKIYGIRKEHHHYNNNNNSKRFDFKNAHGFRKFFEIKYQKMNPINISYLMSHNTGMVEHYYKPTEDVMLQDYVKAIDLQTINEENRLVKQVQELKQKDDYNIFIIDKKLKSLEEAITKIAYKVSTINSNNIKRKNLPNSWVLDESPEGIEKSPLTRNSKLVAENHDLRHEIGNDIEELKHQMDSEKYANKSK